MTEYDDSLNLRSEVVLPATDDTDLPENAQFGSGVVEVKFAKFLEWRQRGPDAEIEVSLERGKIVFAKVPDHHVGSVLRLVVRFGSPSGTGSRG